MWPGSPSSAPPVLPSPVPAPSPLTSSQVPRHTSSHPAPPASRPLPGHCLLVSPHQPLQHGSPLCSLPLEALPAPWLSDTWSIPFGYPSRLPGNAGSSGTGTGVRLVAPVPCAEWPLGQHCWVDVKVSHSRRRTANRTVPRVDPHTGLGHTVIHGARPSPWLLRCTQCPLTGCPRPCGAQS